MHPRTAILAAIIFVPLTVGAQDAVLDATLSEFHFTNWQDAMPFGECHGEYEHIEHGIRWSSAQKAEADPCFQLRWIPPKSEHMLEPNTMNLRTMLRGALLEQVGGTPSDNWVSIAVHGQRTDERVVIAGDAVGGWMENPQHDQNNGMPLQGGEDIAIEWTFRHAGIPEDNTGISLHGGLAKPYIVDLLGTPRSGTQHGQHPHNASNDWTSHVEYVSNVSSDNAYSVAHIESGEKTPHYTLPVHIPSNDTAFGIEVAFRNDLQFVGVTTPNGSVVYNWNAWGNRDARAYNLPMIFTDQANATSPLRVIVPYAFIDLHGAGTYHITVENQAKTQAVTDAKAVGASSAAIGTVAILGFASALSTYRFARAYQSRQPNYVRTVKWATLALALYAAILFIGLIVLLLDGSRLTSSQTIVLLTQTALVGTGFALLAIRNNRRFRLSVAREMSVKARATFELERSNEQLEQFALHASHDLRAPARQVHSFAQLLNRRLDGALNEEDSELLRYLTDSARNMEELVMQLLQFARMGESIEPKSLPMAGVVRRAMSNLSQEAKVANIQVTGDATVEGDASLLSQVLQNLLENAFKFRSDQRPCTILINIGKNETGPYVTVKDNGLGIPAARQSEIFDMFKRAHAHVAGSGLGLALVARIMELHGGTVQVSSTVNVGSTFTLQFSSDWDTTTVA